MTSHDQTAVRLGIIGFGAEGASYARFLAEGRVPGMVIGAACDIDESKRAEAEQFGVPVFEDAVAMMESGTVDAVVTTLPHYLHPEMGILALDRGLHVLAEKPLGVYTRQAQQLIDHASTRPDLTFAVFFNQRANQLYRDLKQLIESGELGRLRHVYWVITTWWRPQGYYDQSEWRATWGGEGGGVLVNQAPHQLDLLQWLCGVPRSVFAKCAYGFARDIAVEDEVNALLDFGEGVTGSFITATHDLAGTDRLEILLDAGKVVVEGSRKVTITRMAQDERSYSRSLGPEQVRGIFSGDFDPTGMLSIQTQEYESVWGQQHVEVLRNFAAAVRGEEPLLADGADGIHGVRLANAIHLSSWTGQEVPLDDFPEELYLRELNDRIRAEGGPWPERA